MSSIVNKVKEAIHPTGTNTGTTGTHAGTTGTHTGTHTGTAEGVAGPHSSRVGNAADPRVDSDLDNRAAHHHTGAGVGTSGVGNQTGAGYGTTGTTGTTGTHHHHAAGTTGTGVGNEYNNTGTTGAGYGSTTGTTTGPHSSNLANKVDPTVDSTSYGTGHTGTHTTGTHTGTHAGNHVTGGAGDRGGISNSTNAGPHNSNLANKADPRVDSDLDNRGNRHGASHGGILGASGSHATHGSGTAQNTNGPHNSDTLNKLDPRVDADGDGSKTYGGNKTYA